MSCSCVCALYGPGYYSCSTSLLARNDLWNRKYMLDPPVVQSCILVYFSLYLVLCYIRSLRSRPSFLRPYPRYTLLTVVAQTTTQDAQRLEAMIAPLEDAAAEERKRCCSRGGAATGVRRLDLARERAKRVSVVDNIMSHVSVAMVGSYVLHSSRPSEFTVTCSRPCTRAHPASPFLHSPTSRHSVQRCVHPAFTLNWVHTHTYTETHSHTHIHILPT